MFVFDKSFDKIEKEHSHDHKHDQMREYVECAEKLRERLFDKDDFKHNSFKRFDKFVICNSKLFLKFEQAINVHT